MLGYIDADFVEFVVDDVKPCEDTVTGFYGPPRTVAATAQIRFD